MDTRLGSATVHLNYWTSGILTPDGTGFYVETLLKNYKAELCNKKKNTFGFALTPKLSLS